MILKNFWTILFLIVSASVVGQKFMIKDNDTLPYADKIVIQTDTTYLGGKTFYPGDTLYESTCETFEKIKGLIVNWTDADCLRQGIWIITDSLGNYWTGIYHDNIQMGMWKLFVKNGKLIKETETISVGKETYEIKEVDYSSGHAVTIIDKPFLAFYLKNIYLIVGLFFITFFGRAFINSKIYNVENRTKYSPIYFYFPRYLSANFTHSLLCTFSFWFSNYKPENRRLVIISNTLSVIALGLIFGIFIASVFSQ
jgi:hypothetical protein